MNLSTLRKRRSLFIVLVFPDKWDFLISPTVKMNRHCIHIHRKGAWKFVLDHGSQYESIPVGKSMNLRKWWENKWWALVLNKIIHADPCWTIYGDLKVISVNLGQQDGCTKYPCFIGDWDRRDKEMNTMFHLDT